MTIIAFRCDGNDAVGAGHVARCLQIARAFRDAGRTVVFVGEYEGTSASLVAAAGVEVRAPAGPGLGIPSGAGAAVVDSYELSWPEMEELAGSIPVAFIADGNDAPSVTAVVSYHLDAERRVRVPRGTVAILGPAYAPVSRECADARRGRERFQHALVALGGGGHGGHAVELVAEELLRHDDVEVFVAGRGAALPQHPRLRHEFVAGGLSERIAWADVAVCGAGSTPYELACAGVPALLLVLADNQESVGRAFAEAGAAISLDARGGLDRSALRAAVERLRDPEERRRLARAGQRLVDGRGAERTRDALLEAFTASGAAGALF